MFTVVFSSVRLDRVRFPFPDIGGQAAKLIDQLEGATGIVDGGLDFSPVSDNALVLQKTRHFPVIEARDLVEGKTGERVPKVFALTKNGQSGQTRLESLEANLLEEPEIVDDRASPFFVMVSPVIRVITSPPAARNAIAGGVKIFVIEIRHRV